MRATRTRCRDERGQAVPLVLGLVAVAVVVLLALVPLARAAQQRAAARNAADAAALAGAAEGEAPPGRWRPRTAPSWSGGAPRGSTCGWWSRSVTPAPRRRPAATAERGAQGRERGCPTLALMPPDEPGAPSPGPRDTGSTATFRPGVEPVDAPRRPAEHRHPRRRLDERRAPTDRPTSRAATEPTAARGRPAGAAPARSPRRRRFLDDPDPDAPDAPEGAEAAEGAGPQGPPDRAAHRAVVGAQDLGAVLPVDLPDHLRGVRGAVERRPQRRRHRRRRELHHLARVRELRGHRRRGHRHRHPTTPTTIAGAEPQLGGSSTTVPVVEDTEDERSTIPDEDGKCAEGQRLVGGFKFEDERIFQSFALGGVVLVLSGAAFSVVLALLFNLISDLTGGVRVTVLEEDPVPGRRPADARPAPRTKA